MENHLYNLFSQLVQDRRSIYRIKKFYLKDAGKCKKCRELWQKILKNKEEETKMILEVLKEHNFSL
jgi:hypothetical protein